MKDPDAVSETARTVAANLRRIRESRKLNQSEVARRTGLARMTIVRAEQANATRVPSMTTLSLIANTLCASLDEILKSPRSARHASR